MGLSPEGTQIFLFDPQIDVLSLSFKDLKVSTCLLS